MKFMVYFAFVVTFFCSLNAGADGVYVGKTKTGATCQFAYEIDEYENLPNSALLSSIVNEPYLEFDVLMTESLFQDIFSSGKAFLPGYELPDPFVEGPTYLYLEALENGNKLVHFRRESEHSSRGRRFLEEWKVVLDQQFLPLTMDFSYKMATKNPWSGEWRWGEPITNGCEFSEASHF